MEFGSLYDAFWNTRVWLPPNTTWDDLLNKPGDTVIKPQASDLWYTLPLAVVIYLIRLFVENVAAVQIGARFNIRQNTSKVSFDRHPALEASYRRIRRPNKEVIEQLAASSKLSVDYVTQWYRSRRNFDKSTKLNRLQDSLWKLVYYGSTWIFGMYQFSTRNWALDVRDCWNGFPNHHLDNEIKWFYLVQIAFYIMCAVTHFTDVRRKDFWAMLIHHVVTLGLMSASYVNNHVRIGCLILITHDVADVNMEFAKILNYIGYSGGSETAFVVFVLNWIVTRLTYYPFVLVRTVAYDVPAILGDDYLFQKFFLALLLGLLCLHIFWFSLILRMVILKLTRGRIEGDVRSDSEMESADENANEADTKNQNRDKSHESKKSN